MAIYHLEAKVISRGIGRSAIAASAYMSCSKILNDYDGVQHDYTKKHGLIYEQVLLPPQAPPEWADRSVLWNAVEQAEKTRDSRLAREFVVALLFCCVSIKTVYFSYLNRQNFLKNREQFLKKTQFYDIIRMLYYSLEELKCLLAIKNYGLCLPSRI